jgi:hypothetical protein
MTRVGHKGKGYNEEQSEMMEENFQPLGGVARAAQSARRLPHTGMCAHHMPTNF